MNRETMMTKTQTIAMDFAVRFTYPVSFTRNLFAPANTLLRDTIHTSEKQHPTKFIVVADANVVKHHPQLIDQIEAYAKTHQDVVKLEGPVITVPGGEASKNQHQHVQTILDAINDYHIDRHSYILAIGGGAVIDMVGYAAATAHRGVRIIRIPTTVLAQNDAAVGVKNSVNAYGKKNFLGTFAPPYAVLNDLNFLHSLEQRDWVAGISEAVKVALLKDKEFFQYISDNSTHLANRDDEAMEWVIYRCAQLHLEHIATNGDPFEMGSSRPLDFGHWAAHKLEQLTNYDLRHGEAVAIGITLDCIYANQIGMLDDASVNAIVMTFEKLGFNLFSPALDVRNSEGIREVFAGLKEFQEHLGGQLTIMLLEAIGYGVEVHEIDLVVMESAIEQLRIRNAQPV